MGKFAVRYVAILGTTLFVFVNFIACGAQMYQVNMQDDFAEERTSEASRNPAAPEFGIHAIGGWANLPIMFEIGDKLNEVQSAGLRKAMKTWETAVGKTLFKFVGKDERDGDSFSDLYSSLGDTVNGHYMDTDWAKTGKPSVVLATTIWDNSDVDTIATADIRFNSKNYVIQDSLDDAGTQLTTLDSSKEVVDMESLALHELGHLLGLAHIPADNDPYSIMNPSLYIGAGLANRRLSKGDILRIQRIYGCEKDACNIDELFARMERMVGDEEDDREDNTQRDSDTEIVYSSSVSSQNSSQHEDETNGDSETEDGAISAH